MPRVPEALNMDQEISFAKKDRITISKNSIAVIILGFIGSIVVTAALVYYLVPCGERASDLSEQLHDVIDNATTESYTETTITNIAPTKYIAELNKTIKPNVRLPRSVLPLEYELTIVPFLEPGNFTFKGEVWILINITEDTKNITLHAVDLTIPTVRLTSLENNASIDDAGVQTNKELEFFIINYAEPVTAGSYILHMTFNGELTNDLSGFYKSSYESKRGTRWIAATQFQPTDARRAFPCFDEPALKATFTITVGRPDSLTAISNMPLVKSETMDDVLDYTWDVFEKSLPMSTYLVAFVVSDLVPHTAGNFTVWAREEASHQTNYSLQVGPAVLRYYEEFFNIPFPLPKIDMVALPDFSAGAMENWGLITYREVTLLYQEGVSTSTDRQRIFRVIAHELSHQWFGNLVTPSWWTDLWLNEGFATYMEDIGMNAVNPDWKVLDQFIANLQEVLKLDALKSSHPILIEVNNPDEINDIFDRISYEKGASIIRMMENFLTNDVFRNGLTNYLNEKKYSSAVQDDLWEALTVQAHTDRVLSKDINVKQIMDTWIRQSGYPILTISRDYDTDEATIKQEQFVLDRSTTNSNGTLWWIPITYTDKSNSISRNWLRGETEMSIKLDTDEDDWVIFNVHQKGYYRVNYDHNNWNLLIAQLKDPKGFHKIHPTNRAQIIDDALSLASAGYLDYEIALNATTYLVSEKDFVPWKAAFRTLDYFNEMFVKSRHFDKFQAYMLALIKPIYESVGFVEKKDEPILTTFLRTDILRRACRLGLPECIKNSVMSFQNWKASPDPDRHNDISPNLKEVIYCTAIRGGGEGEWMFAWKRYLNTNVGTERVLLLAALGCTRETWLLNKYLGLAMAEGSGIRKQDITTVFSSVASNPIGQSLAFRFLTSHWDSIKNYTGSSIIPLNAIRAISLNFNSDHDVDDLRNFAARNKNDTMLVGRPIHQAIEQTETNIRWMRKNFENIVRWLDAYNSGSK